MVELNESDNHHPNLFGSDESSYEDEDDNKESSEDESYGRRLFMTLIEKNDPDITKLMIGRNNVAGENECGLYLPRESDWERDGKAVGGNAILKDLEFWDVDIVNPNLALAPGETRYYTHLAKEHVVDFYRGAARNRSVRKLRFVNCNYLDDVFRAFMNASFFESNQNLECLTITRSTCHRTITRILSNFNSLREFSMVGSTLVGARLGHNALTLEIIEALAGHPRLKTLVLQHRQIGMNGCAAISTLLRNPNCVLTVLDLREGGICDEGAMMLATALAGNQILSTLNLGSNAISAKGCSAISALLQDSCSRLVRLSLQGTRINDDAVLSLANSLADRTTLKCLNLDYNQHVTINGWRSLFTILHRPKCILEDLNIAGNNFDDETVISLAFSLANNSTLIRLDLSGNHNITITGIQAVSTLLQNTNSVLKRLDLCSIFISDDAAYVLSESLTNNTKLAELLLGGSGHSSPRDEIDAAFSRALCNKSSVMDTFASNHTLQKLYHSGWERLLTNDLRSCLQINRENARFDAARLKIIRSHFGGDVTDVRQFSDMGSKVTPHVISWMAKDCVDDKQIAVASFSLLYQFARSSSSLFDLGKSSASIF